MNNLDSNAKQRTPGLKVRTNVKAGGLSVNNNQTLAHGLKVKTNIKAGGLMLRNHSQTLARGPKVETAV